MKQLIAILMLLIPLNVKSQSGQQTDAIADDLIADLIATWTLGVDSNSSTVNLATFNKYKDLFAENARVDDDLRIRFVPGSHSGSYQILPVSKDFDEYAHDVALETNNLRIDEVSRPVRKDQAGQIIYELKRSVFIEKPARYVLPDVSALSDTMVSFHRDIIFEKKNENAVSEYQQEIRSRLRSKIEAHPDSVYKFLNSSTLQVVLIPTTDPAHPLKIKEIRNISNDLHCVNDRDLDGVTDFADVNPDRPGDFSANGAPDADLDGISDSADYCRYAYGIAKNQGCPESYFRTGKQWDASLGLQSNNAMIGLPPLDQLGYQDASGNDATDVLESSEGSLKNSAPSLGVFAGGNFTLFLGRNARKTGISIGLGFTRFVTTYELGKPIVYTYKSNDGSDDYRRQISISSLHEKMSYSVFNFPVQFNYRMKMGEKKNWVMQLRGGPSLLFLQSSTDYNTTMDIGGIYQIDTVSGDRVTYYDHFDRNSTWNVFLTTSGINKQSTTSSAAAVFDGLQRAGGYDFVAGKVYRDQQKLSRLSYALNFSWDAQYKKSQDSPLSLKAGLHVTYGPSTGSSDKYKIVDRSADEYNSIFNSNGPSYYLAYGITLGMVYDF